MRVVEDEPEERRRLPDGAIPTAQRNHNERLVLSTIQQHGAMGAAEIARQTRLSAQTASVITRSLESDGLLVKGDPLRGKIGKPLIPLRLNPDGIFAFGLRIGRRNADIVLIDFLGEVRGRMSTTFRFPTPSLMIEFAAKSLKALSGKLTRDQARRVVGLGIGLPYEIWDWLDSVNAPAEEMQAWKDFNFAESFATFTDLPISVGNDVTLACSGEHVFGLRYALADFAYLHVGTFIGGGLVLGGRVFAGPSGNAGAFGSIPVKALSEDNHQLLQTASLHVLERKLAQRGIAATRMWDPDENWSDFEPDLSDWLEAAVLDLTAACFAVAAVVDVPTFVIDGTFPAPVRTRLAARLTEKIGSTSARGLRKPAIMTGHLGPIAGSLGAAYQPIAEAVLIDGARLYSTRAI